MKTKELIKMFLSNDYIKRISATKQYKYIAVDVFQEKGEDKAKIFFVFYHNTPKVTGSFVQNIDITNIPENLPSEWGTPIVYWYSDYSDINFYGVPHPETKYVSVNVNSLDIADIGAHYCEISDEGELVVCDVEEPNTLWLKSERGLIPTKKSTVDDILSFVIKELKSRSNLVISLERYNGLDTEDKYPTTLSWYSAVKEE